MKILTFEDLELKARWAGHAAFQAAAALIKKHGEIVMLAAVAPSQYAMWKEFLKLLDRDNLTNRIHLFHMDDYPGLPDNDPRSFAVNLRDKFVQNRPFASVTYINRNAKDPLKEVGRLGKAFADHGSHFHLVTCGHGEDNHMAFNAPPVPDEDFYACFQRPRDRPFGAMVFRHVELPHASRMQQVHEDTGFERLADVPTRAYSVNLWPIIDAGVVIDSVQGATKADAMFKTVYEPITPHNPGSILRIRADRRPIIGGLQSNTMVFADRDAASRLDDSHISTVTFEPE